MPTATFPIAAGADDQVGVISGASYPPANRSFASGNTESFGQRSFYSSEFHVWNGLWRWDTSALPVAAAITSANLILTVVGYNNDEPNRSAVFDWHDWSALSTTNNIAVDAPTTGLAASFDLASAFNGTLTLALSGADANVNRTGFTYLRGHVSGGQPTGINRIIPRAFEFSASAAAKLEVVYEVDTTPPAAPTGLAATVITE